MVEAESHTSFDTLAAEAADLLAGVTFQSGAAWWRSLTASAMPPDATPRFVLCRHAGRPAVLVPLQAAGRTLAGLTAPYTCLYQPLVHPGLQPDDVERAGFALGQSSAGFSVLRLDALDADWPGLVPLLAGLRRAGFLSYRFAHFGNWHEFVGGRRWAAYLEARPGALRTTIRRKLRRYEADPAWSFALAHSPEEAEAALPAFEQVYRNSWKRPEPFPRFGPTIIRAAARAGVLRLGVLRCQGQPVAAQYWTVEQGTATVLKLAHDETARQMSAGTVLTAWMIRHLLEEERVSALDFGRGDDAYKQSWVTARRQRIGVMLANPRRPRGLAVLGRAALGLAVRRASAVWS